jgi:hypothetical protein
MTVVGIFPFDLWFLLLKAYENDQNGHNAQHLVHDLH